MAHLPIKFENWYWKNTKNAGMSCTNFFWVMHPTTLVIGCVIQKRYIWWRPSNLYVSCLFTFFRCRCLNVRPEHCMEPSLFNNETCSCKCDTSLYNRDQIRCETFNDRTWDPVKEYHFYICTYCLFLTIYIYIYVSLKI